MLIRYCIKHSLIGVVEKWVQLIFGELEKDYKNQLPFKLIWKCFPFIKINSSMWNKCLNLLITENSQKISVFQIVRNGTRLPISMVLTAIKQSTSSNKIKYILLQSSLLEDEGNGELQSSDLGLEYENDLWSVYKIANLCMTKGFSNIANDLYPKLKCFSNDSYDWVKSLECISIAEKIIKENSKAISLQTLIEFKTKLTTKQPDTNFKSTPAQLETILKWLHQSNSHIKSFQAAKVGFGTFQSTYLEFQISFYYFIDQLCSYKIQMIDVYGLLERLKGMNDQLEKLKTGFYDLDTISFEALTHYNNMLTILSRLVLTVFPLKNRYFIFLITKANSISSGTHRAMENISSFANHLWMWWRHLSQMIIYM
ncbi:hypothetical protein BC833DRAFT_440290 [Globomyces pollinis-pini]|nr:hypothetical protein BC833DRAFT_440290 [Globomyces pollinis-pini]